MTPSEQKQWFNSFTGNGSEWNTESLWKESSNYPRAVDLIAIWFSGVFCTFSGFLLFCQLPRKNKNNFIYTSYCFRNMSCFQNTTIVIIFKTCILYLHFFGMQCIFIVEANCDPPSPPSLQKLKLKYMQAIFGISHCFKKK